MNNFRSLGRTNAKLMLGTETKQYDGAGYNGYGVVLAALAQWRTSGDALDLLPALRAGQWIHNSAQSNIHGVPVTTYYKDNIYWSAYDGLAYLALYEATGAQIWLDFARNYAEAIIAVNKILVLGHGLMKKSWSLSVNQTSETIGREITVN